MLKIIDGELCSPFGVRLAAGVRCPHGVVDGDKTISSEGPRCLSCRELWYPLESNSAGERIAPRCPDCGARLHKSYDVSYDHNGFAGTRRQVLTERAWGHELINRCSRNYLPIRGAEKNYKFYGWGSWETYSKELLSDYLVHLEFRHEMRRRSSAPYLQKAA